MMLAQPDLTGSVSKMLKHPEHIAVMQGGATWPLHVSYCLTSRCQLHCEFCCLGWNDRTTDLEWDVFAESITRFANHGAGAVQLSGGEPLLWPYFDEAVKLCVQKGMAVGVQTNGMNIEAHAESLALVEWVRVGVYSKKQLDGLRLDLLNPSVPTQLTTVWHNDQTEEFILACRAAALAGGCEAVRVMADSHCPASPVMGIGRAVCNRIGHPVQFVQRNGHAAASCWQAWWKVAVDWNGWLYPCGCFSDEQTRRKRRICHVRDASEFYAKPPADMGHRCMPCIYAEQNALLDQAMQPVRHGRFL